MKEFFRVPTKVTFLAILAVFVSVSLTSGQSVADEKKPILDLQKGGVQFFKEIVPSIAQIYNGGLYTGGGSAGSGYIIDREGHMITNFHVSSSNDVLEIAFYGDEKLSRQYREGRHRAVLVAEDPALDLAVLKVEAPADKFHPVKLGDSSLIQAGDTVATFGSPGGDPGWVDRSQTNMADSWLEFYNLNLGVISEVLTFEEAFWTYNEIFALDNISYFARAGVRDYGSAVQYLFHTDSAINHGNSGGPCLNVYGEAVGTNTWGFPGENVGFSVPVNLLKRSVADMIQYGRVKRPWVGISLHPARAPQGELNKAWNIEAVPFTGLIWFDTTPDQMMIYHVNPYAPAYEAGLRPGDIIKRIDGRVFQNVFDVYSYFLSKNLDDQVVIEYERNNQPMSPAVIKVAEKKTRFDNRKIEAYAVGRWAQDITRYSADITY